MKYLRIIFFSFTIWVVAALINAAVSATILSFSGSRFESWPGAFVLALFFSLLFSAPGIFIFGIVFLANAEKQDLFGILLRTGIFTAIIAAVLFVAAFGKEFRGLNFFIALSGVISAIIAMLIHHSSIRSLHQNSTDHV